MLSKIFKVLIFVVIAVVLFFSGVNLSISSGQYGVLSAPLWIVWCAIVFILWIISFVKTVASWIVSLFSSKPNMKKGIEQLQIAFSGLLARDYDCVLKALSKAKKNLGDIPLVSWLEGQFHLMTGNIYEAKAIFFKMGTDEKRTALGAYSLSQLAAQDCSRRDSLEALKTIIETHSGATSQIKTLVSFCVKEGLFEDAIKYLKKLPSDKKRSIEGIIYYEKWKVHKKLSDLEKAFDLLPNIPDIALDYCEELTAHKSNRKARKVLEKSFELFPCMNVFERYISLDSDHIKLAQNLKDLAYESWIPLYGLSKLLRDEELYAQALNYLIKAFQYKNYDFIAKEIHSLQAIVNQEGSDEDTLDLSAVSHVNFLWYCRECGLESQHWQSICSKCSAPASYEFKEIIEERLPIQTN